MGKLKFTSKYAGFIGAVSGILIGKPIFKLFGIWGAVIYLIISTFIFWLICTKFDI